MRSSSDKFTPVLFFLGPGGVGKTTVSSLNAIKHSLDGKKVLIATFDPSPRLKDILANKEGFENKDLNENLEVVILDSRLIFENLLSKTDESTAKSIQKNKLFKHLIERIHGVHEFSSLYFLSENVNTKQYDLIIIDTPPLQNSIDFFTAPQKLKELFESTIVKLFIGDFNNNWFEKIFKKTRDVAFSTLKKLTGHDFFDQLISFMTALEKLQPIILKTIDDSQSILLAKTTEYSFVTSYEVQNLVNAESQMQLVKAANMNFESIYINKYEQDSLGDIEDLDTKAKDQNLQKLASFLKYKKDVFEKQSRILKKLLESTQLKTYVLPQFPVSEINEEQLILRSKDIHELKS